MDGSDDNTGVNVHPHDSGPPASSYSQDKGITIQEWLQDIKDGLVHSCPARTLPPPGLPQILELSTATHMLLMAIRAGNMKAQCTNEARLITLEDKIDAAWTENTVLRKAYHTSRGETALLKAAVDTLMKKLDENSAISAPPSPETTTTSTAMEEMMMQLSHIRNDIQDILDAVRNPPGKRKRRTSG
jgi:hypothetical protein